MQVHVRLELCTEYRVGPRRFVLWDETFGRRVCARVCVRRSVLHVWEQGEGPVFVAVRAQHRGQPAVVSTEAERWQACQLTLCKSPVALRCSVLMAM